jgi:hypothetical protein
MPRDRIAELLSIRQRAGKYKRAPSKFDLERLKDTWHNQLKGIDPTDELIPIRIVTILEVFLRHWIEALIDHGAPYVERASKLKVDVKYDFAIAHSLQGGSVSLGQLIAHSLSLSRIESFCGRTGHAVGSGYFRGHFQYTGSVEGKARGRCRRPDHQRYALGAKNVSAVV